MGGRLRFHYNIGMRMLIQVAGFNLGLLMRKRFGIGTPRGRQGRLVAAIGDVVIGRLGAEPTYRDSSCLAKEFLLLKFPA